MSRTPSPTIRWRRLRAELKRLRGEVGLTAAQAADRAGWSMSKISRIESGKNKISPGDSRELLDAYGVPPGEEYDRIVQLARDARGKSKWQPYYESIGSFALFLDLESEASKIRAFEVGVVPGLLQTEDYHRALIAALRPSYSADEVTRFVELRKARQVLLDGPARYWAVMHEGAVRTAVGGPPVMRAQLEHIAEIAEVCPNVTVQVLPFSEGAHPVMTTGFVTLNFPDPQDPGIVTMDQPHGNVYLEEPEQVAVYDTAFDHLCSAALRDSESVRFLREAARELRP